MATKPSKRVTRVRVERSREQPEPVKVEVIKRPSKSKRPSDSELIRQGIADRTFI